MAAVVLKDTGRDVPDQLLNLLQAHIPYSLPLLRRLQFVRNFPAGGSTPTSHVLLAYYYHHPPQHHPQTTTTTTSSHDVAAAVGNNGGGGHFAAAYVDLSRAPETEAWLYCTAEDPPNPNASVNVDAGAAGEECDELVSAILRRIRNLSGNHNHPYPQQGQSLVLETGIGRRDGEFILGSVHETTRQRMLARGVRMRKTSVVADGLEWEFCGKWLFRVPDLPDTVGINQNHPLGEGEGTMSWDKLRKQDMTLVRSRTSIQRQEATLLLLPSTCVRKGDGVPIAWAFLGLDGTLMTLHVEEPYRGKGLAKALACKIMRDHTADYGEDGWGLTDVFEFNRQSQGVCKSIGGKLSWTCSWAVVDLSSVGEP
ncbi:hypothetical protein QBC46DRAFT_301094 [Diplogelasinospora grovesii]|uniref:FR47-like domain-containing protein n=1 Tax=Diplogelasinospora grovesii TaxID=303347 RepID=A0AAN6RYK1_9PEZI|nr:hypothetical protein QBC46DRAFT_301094 [Diplogelasinospora grovesii]